MPYVIGITGRGLYHERGNCASMSLATRCVRTMSRKRCRELGLRLCGRCKNGSKGGGKARATHRLGSLQRAVLELAGDGRILTARRVAEELGYVQDKVPDHIRKALNRLHEVGRLCRFEHAEKYRGRVRYAYQDPIYRQHQQAAAQRPPLHVLQPPGQALATAEAV